MKWQNALGLIIVTILHSFRTMVLSVEYCIATNGDLNDKITFLANTCKKILYLAIFCDYFTTYMDHPFISGSFRISLFINLGCPSDMGKRSSCFMIIRWPMSWFVWVTIFCVPTSNITKSPSSGHAMKLLFPHRSLKEDELMSVWTCHRWNTRSLWNHILTNRKGK